VVGHFVDLDRAVVDYVTKHWDIGDSSDPNNTVRGIKQILIIPFEEMIKIFILHSQCPVIVRFEENLLSDNIDGATAQDGILAVAQNKHFEGIWIATAAHGNVKLAMSKHRVLQVQANPIKGLALALVNRHGKGQAHRELDALEIVI